MRPIFTVHAGEYLVGQHIESKFKDKNVGAHERSLCLCRFPQDRTKPQVKFFLPSSARKGNALPIVEHVEAVLGQLFVQHITNILFQ